MKFIWKRWHAFSLFKVPVFLHWSLVFHLAIILGLYGINESLWQSAAMMLITYCSLLFHEFCHVIVARKFSIGCHDVTLFVCGAVAGLEKDPKVAKEEFCIAAAGPLASLFLAAMASPLACYGYVQPHDVPISMTMWGWPFTINFAMVIFNLLPLYPMDGGRILRSGLTRWKGFRFALKWTKVVSTATGIIAFGVLIWQRNPITACLLLSMVITNHVTKICPLETLGNAFFQETGKKADFFMLRNKIICDLHSKQAIIESEHLALNESGEQYREKLLGVVRLALAETEKE